MKDSWFKKYKFSLNWQVQPKCLGNCWGKEVSGLIGCFVEAGKLLGLVLLHLAAIPFGSLVVIFYPIWHLGIYPVYAAFKMQDGLVDKLNKRTEETLAERVAEQKTDELFRGMKK